MRIIHLLQWPINSIRTKLDTIKNQGFDSIQISPLQGTKEIGTAFWLLYQPTNFKIGNTQIGTREDLINLCKEAHEYNLKIIVDVVFRHTANDNENWLKPSKYIDTELQKDNFFLDVVNIKDYNDRWQCTNLAENLPVINYRNKDVQDIQIRYLSDLVDCGVDGFRIDMAKNFELPSEGCDYFERVFIPFKDKVIYGEVINAPQELIDKYSEIMLVATNSRGSDRDKIVTWVESHDTYLTFENTKYLSEAYINYAYDQLCSEFANTLYYVRPFSDAWEKNVVRYANSKDKTSK